jgi:hypothetical protein
MAVASMAVLALALGGCGGSGKSSGTAASTTGRARKLPPGVVPDEVLPPARALTYTAHLVPFSGGSPSGSAVALVSLNPATSQLCWQFSQLTNVTSPTVARLYQSFPGASGTGGYLLGSTFNSSGCISRPKVIIQIIESRPQTFYVSIHTAQFPGGAVRGPL